jgi:hypothetical protein
MIAQMSPARGRRTTKTHTPETLEAVVEELRGIAASIEVSASRLKDNDLPSVGVPHQATLDRGLDSLHTWAGGVGQAIGEAIRNARFRGVSDRFGSVSEDDPESN